MHNTKTRVFDFQDGKSCKFWEITQADEVVTVRYGKTGSTGQSQTKAFADAASASKHVQKLIAEKLGKGYVEQGDAGAVRLPVAVAPAQPKAVAQSKVAKSVNPVRDPEASAESLAALLDKDDATNRQLAKHPKANEDLLEKLSHSSDQATRRAVCLNPNANKDVLIRLAPQFPGDFFLNLVFDWLLLEDPGLLFQLGKGVLKNILKRSDCPLSFIQWAAKHGSEQEQLALAMNPSTPAEVIKTLAKRKGTVGDAVRGRVKTTGAETAAPEDLESTYVAEVKKALAEVSPDEVLSAWKRRMITNEHRPWLNLECRVLLANIPLSLLVAGAMTGHEQELAATAQLEVRVWVARFLEDDAKLLETLSEDANHEVRAAVAINKHCPTAIFKNLLEDKNAGVRASAARSVNISPEQAAVLATDSSPTVRAAACAAWCIPVDSLQALAQERSAAIRKPALARMQLMVKPAGNPATTPDELSKIAESAKAGIKLLLAANPSMPVRWLQQFANDANASLDKALLENPRLPADVANVVFRRVVETSGPLQRINLLEHPRIPKGIRELAGQNAWQSQWPQCRDWQKEAYEFLAAPRTGYAEKALLEIPNGMESAYAGSTLRSARLLGLSHPRVPPELLIKRSNSVDWVERLAIARNTSLPPNLVAKFQKDAHRLVAAQAQATAMAKARIKERQEGLLAQVLLDQACSPVDWQFIVESLYKEIMSKGVRSWEWYGTPWWPHLPLRERMGLDDEVRYRRSVAEIKLASCFLASPFSRDRLFTFQWKPIQDCLAESEDTPLSVLESMFSDQENIVAQKNWLTRVRLVDDPRLPEKFRAATSDDQQKKWRQLRLELLGHPDTPMDVLLHLAQQVESESEAKRYLQSILLPKEVQRVLEEVCKSKADNPFNPDWVSDPKPDVRRRALGHPYVPIEAIEQLQKDKNNEVRLLAELVYLGNRPTFPVDDRAAKIQALLKKVLSKDAEFKAELCASIRCPPEILEALSGEKDVWSYARKLAGNPNTPEGILIKLGRLTRSSGWPRDVTNEVCANPAATPAVFQALLNSKSGKLRARVAGAKGTSKELLLNLARDCDPLVRVAIARREDTDPEIQAGLATDPDPNVRLALVKSERLSSELLALLANDVQLDVRNAVLEGGLLPPSMYVELVRKGLRALPQKCIVQIDDEATLETLAREGADFASGPGKTLYSAQKSILQKALVPASVLTILAEKTEFRRDIALRPDLPIKLLESFANDSNEKIVAAALSNSLIPEALMRKVVASKSNREYWDAVIDNPFSPSDLMDSASEKIEIPRWRAKSWYAKKLAGDTREEQTQAFIAHAMKLAQSSRATQEKLQFMSASGIWVIRWAVASNPSSTELERKHILEDLWSEMEEALWGPKPLLPSFDVLKEDGIRSALERLDILPPAQDKQAIAAAARSSEMLHRIAVILSPGVQPSVLKMLLEDPVDSVKTLAAEKLRAQELPA